MLTSVVCDGCSLAEIEKLERGQLDVARIVTGLPILASTESLYFERGCESLTKRQKLLNLRL